MCLRIYRTEARGDVCYTRMSMVFSHFTVVDIVLVSACNQKFKPILIC